MQHVGLRIGEPKRDVFDRQFAAHPSQVGVPVDDGVLDVEDLSDSVGGGHRVLGHREQEPERSHRPDQRHHQGGERDERAQRDLFLGDGQGTEGQHDDEGDAGDDAQEREEGGLNPDPGERRVVQVDAALVEAGEDVVSPAE